jgi:hypothetical protein
MALSWGPTALRTRISYPAQSMTTPKEMCDEVVAFWCCFGDFSYLRSGSRKRAAWLTQSMTYVQAGAAKGTGGRRLIPGALEIAASVVLERLRQRNRG